MAGSQGSSQRSSVQLLCPAVVVVHPECVTITTSILSFWLVSLHFTTRTNGGVLKLTATIQHEIPGHSKSRLSQISQLLNATLLTAMYFINTLLFFSFFAPQSFKLNIIHLPGTNNEVFFPSQLSQYLPYSTKPYTFSSTNTFPWNTSLNASLKNKYMRPSTVGLPIRSVITSKNTIGLVWHDHLLLKVHYIFITFSTILSDNTSPQNLFQKVAYFSGQTNKFVVAWIIFPHFLNVYG